MVKLINYMEHTGLLSLNLTPHFNRMGGKNRRANCRKTVHGDKQDVKESFSQLSLNALISLIFHEYLCATTAAYSTRSGAQHFLHIH